MLARGCEVGNKFSEMKGPGMKMVLVVWGAISILFVSAEAAVVGTNSLTRPASPPPAAKSDRKARGLPFHGNVAAIDKAARSITMEGKMHRVFHVTTETKINKDKKPSKWEALAVGDYVGGYARETPDGK